MNEHPPILPKTHLGILRRSSPRRLFLKPLDHHILGQLSRPNLRRPSRSPRRVGRDRLLLGGPVDERAPARSPRSDGGEGRSLVVRDGGRGEFRESGLEERELGGEDPGPLGRVGGGGEFACRGQTIDIALSVLSGHRNPQ